MNSADVIYVCATRRIASGVEVGTHEKNVKSRLMNVSERIRIAAQRVAAVAFMTLDIGYLPLLMPWFTSQHATAMFADAMGRRNQRYAMETRCRN
jgi:hypothetical protein